MDAMLYLIFLSVIIAIIVGIGLWWSIINGQYDDLQGCSDRTFFCAERSDEPKSPSTESKQLDVELHISSK